MDAPLSLIGNVISTVRASGRALNGSGSSEVGSNSKRIVSGLGAAGRDVAAYEICLEMQRGTRKVEVQPAPKMRRSTWLGAVHISKSMTMNDFDVVAGFRARALHASMHQPGIRRLSGKCDCEKYILHQLSSVRKH